MEIGREILRSSCRMEWAMVKRGGEKNYNIFSIPLDVACATSERALGAKLGDSKIGRKRLYNQKNLQVSLQRRDFI